MANSKQAKKRVKQADKRRAHNASRRSMMRTFLKKTIAAIEEGNKELAQATFVKTSSTLDKLAGKGLIHANKAARHKSRLTKRIKAMAAS